MEAQLRDWGLNFEFVAGVQAKEKKVGVARSHLDALSGCDDRKPSVVRPSKLLLKVSNSMATGFRVMPITPCCMLLTRFLPQE